MLAAAVAGMFAAAVPQAGAQTPPATPMPMSNDSMMRGGMMMNGTPDYSLLAAHHSYDYTDLKFAERRGYSDSEIATVAKIADKTGWSFRDVLAMVARGRTFGSIATEANLRLSDVLDVDDEKQKIADYKATYETTGMMGMKNMGMMHDSGMMKDKMMKDKMMNGK